MKYLSSLSTLSLMLAAACGDSVAPIAADELTWSRCDADSIALPGEDFYPEGIAADEDGVLYVGSAPTGAIVRAEPCGAVTILHPRKAGGRGTLGMLVDTDGSTLWTCDVEFGTFGTPAALIGYDLTTGAEVGRHTFPSDAFICNDLAQGTDGSLYATDSFGAKLLRVSGPQRAGNSPAEVWLEDPSFSAPAGAFGLNGIVAVDDRLFFVNYARGSLHRVTVASDGKPTDLVEIIVDRPLTSLDGIEARGASTLFAAEHRLFSDIRQSDLVRIDLKGTRGTVQVEASELDGPTTFVRGQKTAWYVEGQLDHLFGIDPAPPSLPFRVVRTLLP